jgi:NADPH-dependent 2,4-dienoyl-CoA reductase/sulfur reductase-like enzyme
LREVRLEDGETIAADLCVVGLGVMPATQMVRGIALREDGGVGVDAQLRAAPGLHAAGDVAAFPLFGDGPRIRVEHWRVAEQQGRVAALGMLGRKAAYTAVPYFWTIQFGERLDYVGHAESWDEIVVDGDVAKPAFIAYYVKEGTVAAAAGFGRDRDMAALIVLLGQRRWTPASLVGRSPADLLGRASSASGSPWASA